MDYIAIIKRLAIKSTHQSAQLDHTGYWCQLCDTEWGADDEPKHRFTCPVVARPIITDNDVVLFQRAYREQPTGLGESLKIRHALEATFSPEFVPTHKHKGRGTFYRMIRDKECMIEKDWSPGVVYQATDGLWIIRPKDEFEDGRFEEVK